MKDKTVAILEARVADQMADLVRKYGGTPFSAPALAEIPDVDPAHIGELLGDWVVNPPDLFIFQTGVGVKALLAATDSLGLTDKLLQLLAAAPVVVRGPKPTDALRSRAVRMHFRQGSLHHGRSARRAGCDSTYRDAGRGPTLW
jgi:uroporphyrinogen-III synthase